MIKQFHGIYSYNTQGKQTLKLFSCAVCKIGDFRDKILLTNARKLKISNGKEFYKKSLPFANLDKKLTQTKR